MMNAAPAKRRAPRTSTVASSRVMAALSLRGSLASISRRSLGSIRNERLRASVQLRDQFVRTWARGAVACFDLSILLDADTDQPSCAADPETSRFRARCIIPGY